MQKKGFTLIEILLVLSWFIILIGIIFWLYQSLFTIKNDVSARQILVEQTYYTMEKIQILLKDFTIDYEEYRNRQIVGCNGDPWLRDVGPQWYCNNPSYYGNSSSTDAHRLYSCSSTDTQPDPSVVQATLTDGEGCLEFVNTPQSFGQYAKHFQDVKSDDDSDGNLIGDADDEDLGIGPAAIVDTGVQEIYLISPDKTQRLLIRRASVENSSVSNYKSLDVIESRYTLQILKLQWLDAWSNHDFDPEDISVYDGQIDTRVCDAAQWFICEGASPWGMYSWFNMPADAEDGRVDLLDHRITVADRSLQIFPTADADYARADPDVQLNPYIRIFMNVQLYPGYWQSKLGVDRNLEDFSFPIQTTFNIKTWYTK
jgi:type II secretory pathway pseudopilin PulG